MNEPQPHELISIRKDFLAYLKYTKGHSEATCYGYQSDLKIWQG